MGTRDFVVRGFAASDDGHTPGLCQFPCTLVIKQLNRMPRISQLGRIVARVMDTNAKLVNACRLQSGEHFVGALIGNGR